MSFRTFGRGSAVCVRGVGAGIDDTAGVGPGLECVERLSLLISARKAEKASDARSIRVRSVNRVFSATNASFCARKSSASLALAATSPSSCPIYSSQELASVQNATSEDNVPFLLDRKALAETLFLSWRRSLLLSFLPSSLASNLSSSSMSSSSFLILAICGNSPLALGVAASSSCEDATLLCLIWLSKREILSSTIGSVDGCGTALVLRGAGGRDC